MIFLLFSAFELKYQHTTIDFKATNFYTTENIKLLIVNFSNISNKMDKLTFLLIAFPFALWSQLLWAVLPLSFPAIFTITEESSNLPSFLTASVRALQ